MAIVPINRWLPTAGKLVAEAFRHPNTDKVMVVSGDGKNVKITPAPEQGAERTSRPVEG